MELRSYNTHFGMFISFPNHCERLYDFPLLLPFPPPLPAHRLSLIAGRGREGRFPAAAQGGEKKGAGPE